MTGLWLHSEANASQLEAYGKVNKHNQKFEIHDTRRDWERAQPVAPSVFCLDTAAVTKATTAKKDQRQTVQTAKNRS